MAKHQMDNWTTQSISKETARLTGELAGLITERDHRLRRCSKHEAIHQAVAEMIERLKKRKR